VILLEKPEQVVLEDWQTMIDIDDENFFQRRKEELGYGLGKNPIHQAKGITSAERSLQRLAQQSFLSLWSYCNLYVDRGEGKNKRQEFCDLLVVFGNHVLIFSDKDIAYPDTKDRELAWKRWYKRAVAKSAEQIYGAERWLKQHPDRIFLDKACTQPFPLDLPKPENMIVHRVVVAHGASEWCKKELGGSGSLMIVPKVIGDAHYDLTPPMRPFTIGQVNPAKGFIHVFDDTSLNIVMNTLDTITDFTNYLQRKQCFIESGKLTFATGEDDLLAFYLHFLNDADEHDFVVSEEIDFVSIDEGAWEDFSNHPRRLAQLEADAISYFWDELIEKFNHHILNDTQYFTSEPGPKHSEQIIRLMAQASRFRRRFLARSLLDLVRRTPSDMKAVRVIPPAKTGEPFYFFLLLPNQHAKTVEAYRMVRHSLLEAYCLVIRLKHPAALDIIGIATEAGNPGHSGEDSCYFDGRNWTPELEAKAKSLQRDLGLLKNLKMRQRNEQEYPESTHAAPKNKLKGNQRNAPCPCESGKKYKHCHGRG
jgi:SEC-C motif